MEKEFVPYELAVKLKALGFDEPCLLYWYRANNGFALVDEMTQSFQNLYTKAPLFQQAFRWFREKYGLWASIGFDEYHDDEFEGMYWNITHAFEYGIGPIFFLDIYKTPEEAELACLEKFCEIVETKSE